MSRTLDVGYSFNVNCSTSKARAPRRFEAPATAASTSRSPFRFLRLLAFFAANQPVAQPSSFLRQPLMGVPLPRTLTAVCRKERKRTQKGADRPRQPRNTRIEAKVDLALLIRGIRADFSTSCHRAGTSETSTQKARARRPRLAGRRRCVAHFGSGYARLGFRVSDFGFACGSAAQHAR
jgi:hypothetical protein